MDTEHGKKRELPGWVREALEAGELTDNLPNKRSEPRHVWTVFCIAQSQDKPSADPFTARVFNVCSGGVGFVARKQIRVGQRVKLTPEGDTDDIPVFARVVHCTQTVQGYKVGCAFEPPA